MGKENTEMEKERGKWEGEVIEKFLKGEKEGK